MHWTPFPELTEDENEVVFEARACGFASFYPALPDAEAQARNTLAGARKWLETHHIREGPDDDGSGPARHRHAVEKLEYVECPSCLGYGHINDETGEPTVDRRERKCLDCRGEGTVPARPTPPRQPLDGMEE